ncbi:MAG: hypothetical protein LC750_14765, partial [Actinobacteria bacterium]|nr:hypothetical protein [Actinomycetota bacterium]
APASGGHWTKSLTFTRGSHQIRAQAFVGTAPGKTSDVRTFTVDNSAPANTIAGPPGAAQGVAAMIAGDAITGSATDNNNSFDSGVDHITLTFVNAATNARSSLNAVCTGCRPSGSGASVTWSSRPGLAAGAYSVSIVAYDKAGNPSSSLSFRLVFA